MTTVRKTTWNTYFTSGYTHGFGGDPRAAGGVCLHQVRKGKAGWQKRKVNSNGNFEEAGAVQAVTDAEGEALFARAEAS